MLPCRPGFITWHMPVTDSFSVPWASMTPSHWHQYSILSSISFFCEVWAINAHHNHCLTSTALYFRRCVTFTMPVDLRSADVELIYLELGEMGRGEVLRVLMNAWGIPYRDTRWAFDPATWPERKAQLIASGDNPAAKVPVLKINGECSGASIDATKALPQQMFLTAVGHTDTAVLCRCATHRAHGNRALLGCIPGLLWQGPRARLPGW